MRPVQKTAFSWRDDPAVPDFDEGRLLVVMDGDCALCSATARRVARLDRADQVRICTSASPLGQGLLAHFDLSPEDPDSWLLVAEGQAYGGLDAAMRLFPRLHRSYRPLLVMRLLPVMAQDWLYARLARNRYRLFGRTEICALPDPELRKRFLG